MKDTLLTTISPTPYTVSVEPGGTAQVHAQATMAVFLQLQDNNTEACPIHDNNNNMDVTQKIFYSKQ